MAQQQTRTILRLQEIADRTGVSLDTLRYYRKTGTGGPRTWKLGRRVVAYEDDVERWLREQEAASSDGVPAA